MRRLLLMLLLFCLLLLTGCTAWDPVASMVDGQPETSISLPAEDELPLEECLSTLWFRFGNEPFLAPETRKISASSDDALTLLQALLAGPSAASELNNPFPPGTRVLSVSQSGRVIFVTLSRHIMNSYADEPASWQADPAWAIEVPLRRALAMQSIAATLTENCDADSVIILVEQTGMATDSLRLRQHYYTLDGDTSLAAPLIRDESLLLTPARTAQVILQYWQEADWQRLYHYIARTDAVTGAARPEETAFIRQMEAAPRLVRWHSEGGSISGSGRSALFTLSGTWLEQGTEQPFEGLTLRLTLEKGIWRTSLSQLSEREAMQ